MSMRYRNEQSVRLFIKLLPCTSIFSPPVILGVTNPFFAKTLQHWPHIIRIGEMVEGKIIYLIKLEYLVKWALVHQICTLSLLQNIYIYIILVFVKQQFYIESITGFALLWNPTFTGIDIDYVHIYDINPCVL